MRNRFHWALAFVTAISAGAVAVGCEGGETKVDTTGAGGQTGGTTSSSSTGGGGAGGDAGAPPVACPSNEGVVFAVNQLYFGEGPSGEWKKVGYNLDDKISTGKSTDLCKTNAMGLPDDAYPDGENGIDNSFGKNLLPLVLSLYNTWVTDINNGIGNGRFTALVKLMCLPEGPDAPQFTTKLFGGAALAGPPKLDGSDTWPVEPGLLSDPMDAESSTILFTNSSLTANFYDAGKGGTFIISVPLKTATETTSIKLTLYSARITMNLEADRSKATGGMIGGVLDTEEFVAEIKKVGFLMGLCGNALLDNILNKVRQSSDMMLDGSHDPNVPCNAISMGLGFDMVAAKLGEVGPANIVGDSCQ